MTSSMLYTMGMAIDRAAQHGLLVSVLVEGQWVDGLVAANDGIGVVLECTDGSHVVVRTERVSLVKVMAESPYHQSIESHPAYADAFPMPGQRDLDEEPVDAA